MDHLRLIERPLLNNPTLITAFAGWNDAAQAATSALRFLLRHWSVEIFAEIDPEDFFDFTQTRPTVRVVDGTVRRIEWPETKLFYHRDAEQSRDFVLLLGVEPQLRWHTFVTTILAVCSELGVSGIVSLGSMIEELSHVRPAKVTGLSNNQPWTARMRRLDVISTHYEGPTGIVGVLNALAGESGLATASLRGVIPSYLSAVPNPKVTLGMLCRLDGLLELNLDLGELEAQARQFDARVAEFVAKNPKIASYLRQLEAKDKHGIEDQKKSNPHGGIAPSSSSGNIVDDVEEFLRHMRRERDQ